MGASPSRQGADMSLRHIRSTLSTRDRAWLEATFVRNRAAFGDLRMEIAPVVFTPPPAPIAPAVATPPVVPPVTPPAVAAPVAPPTPNGYPENTPWRQMEPAEQVLYWQHHARTHEDALKVERTKNAELAPLAEQKRAADELNKTDAQREIDRLTAENATLAKQRADDRKEFGTGLVESRLSAAAEGKGKTLAQMKTIAGNLDRFLNDGAVNGEAVDSFLAELPDKAPEQNLGSRNLLGAGRQQSATLSGPAAGAELFAQRHTKKPPLA